MTESIRTLLDSFDFSNKIHQADLQDILEHELTDREREIMICRLGSSTSYQFTMSETAVIFKLDHDEIASIESKVVRLLEMRGVPRK